MTKTRQLPDVAECIAYVEGLGYRLKNSGRSWYLFVDTSGQRPEHNREMFWSLGQMRDAVRYGC